ncbi:MAG: DUF2341 domain-containing protein [Crocinitomicaceae bacterium]
MMTFLKIIRQYCLFPLVTILLLGSTQFTYAQPPGYSFGKQLLVNSAQVAGSTNLTNFVMLVSFTDTDLRTTVNGGNVESSNGFDIVFTLGDCNTLLDHQIEEYNATTGEYIAWVRIPTLLASSNTNIHMYYGNSSVSNDPSTTDVWNSDYAAVWHMNQSPAGSSPQLTDYTANTNDGIANGSMTAGDLVTGRIGNGIDFDGTDDFFDCGSDASTTINNDITVSAWMFSTAASGHVINRGGGWDDPGYSLFLLSNAIRIELQRSGEKDIVDNGITINAWHYVALTYDQSAGTIRCFIDGVQQGNTGNHTGPMGNPVENLNIARKEQNAFYFDGIIDEGRVISAERSADWILTEYRNQNAPNTFYTKSAEFGASNLCWTLPVELTDFTAQEVNNIDAQLNWTTASEINNDYFVIEKSIDANSWFELARVKGAGTSFSTIDYSYIDENLKDKISYYRLKQIDFDGSSSLSKTESVTLKYLRNEFSVYPNPASNQVTIETKGAGTISIRSATGQIINQLIVNNSGSTIINIESLPKGIYFVEFGNTTKKLIKQ